MEIISYTTARNNLAEKMQQVCDDHTPIVITRRNKQSLVLISFEDYQSMNETYYLLSNPVNAVRLTQAIDEIETSS